MPPGLLRVALPLLAAAIAPVSLAAQQAPVAAAHTDPGSGAVDLDALLAGVALVCLLGAWMGVRRLRRRERSHRA